MTLDTLTREAYHLLMSIPGFDNAQARYDSMTPEDPPIFRCMWSGESNEDCDQEHGDECRPDEYDPSDEEPADFDDWRHGIDDHLDDYGD